MVVYWWFTMVESVKLLAEPSATLPPGSDRKKRFMVLGESAERFLPSAPKNIWENTSSELLTLQGGHHPSVEIEVLQPLLPTPVFHQNW